eukprot:scaffold8631_cov108-Isochrysis_galbana.AAC.16
MEERLGQSSGWAGHAQESRAWGVHARVPVGQAAAAPQVHLDSMTAWRLSSLHVSALSCCEANSVGDWMLTRIQRPCCRPTSRSSSNEPTKQSSVGGR